MFKFLGNLSKFKLALLFAGLVIYLLMVPPDQCGENGESIRSLGNSSWSVSPDDSPVAQPLLPADSLAEQVAVRLLSQAALEVADWEYTNYGFFSTVTLPGTDVVYTGAFGMWQRAEEKST